MKLVKKWLSCVVSFVLGVCGLSLSACSGMILKTSIDASALGTAGEAMSGTTTSITKGFKVITDPDLFTQAKDMGLTTEFVWMKVFAIITLVASILLIAHSVVLLLRNLNVIKSSSKVFEIITLSLVGLMLVSTIGLLISSNVYANGVEAYALSSIEAKLPSAYISQIKYGAVAKVGLYQPLMLGISILTTIAVVVNSILRRKEA